MGLLLCLVSQARPNQLAPAWIAFSTTPVYDTENDLHWSWLGLAWETMLLYVVMWCANFFSEMAEGEGTIGEAYSHIEAFDSCVTSLLSESEAHQELAGKVKAFAETWQDLKKVITGVFSAKDGEIRHLKYTLEKIEFEKTSAENFSKGLRDELQVVTSSLARLRGNIMETSLQDGNCLEAKNSKLAEQSNEQTSLPLQGLAGEGGLGPRPSAKGEGLTPDQETKPKEMEPRCSKELPHSEKPEEEGAADQSLQTGMELGQEAISHSKEQGPPMLKTGMEPETDGIAFQHGIGGVNVSPQNPKEPESGLHCSDSQVPSQEAGMDVQEPAPGLQPVPCRFCTSHNWNYVVPSPLPPSSKWYGGCIVRLPEDGVCNSVLPQGHWILL